MKYDLFSVTMYIVAMTFITINRRDDVPAMASNHIPSRIPKLVCNLLWIGSFLFFLSLLGTVLLTSDLPDVRPPQQENTDFTHGWYYKDGDTAHYINNFPFTVSSSEQELILYHQLPPLGETKYLCFSNQFQEVKAYIGNVCIYEYQSSQTTPAGKILGDFRCFIPLEPNYQGQTLSLHLISTSPIIAKGLQTIELGSQDSFVLDIVSDNFSLALCLIFMLIIALLLYLGYIIQAIKKLTYDYRIFLYLGRFLLLSALWMWSDSELPQLMFRNATLICLISFFTFMALPIPLFSFVETFCRGGKPLLLGLQILYTVNILVQFLLYSLGILDFPTMLPVTHSLILLSILVIVRLLFREAKLHSSYEAKGMLLAILLLILFSVAALIQFYLSPHTDNSKMFRYGLILFIGILLFLSGRKVISFLEERTQTALYQKLAYTDMMTDTQNRIAFEEYMDSLRQSGISGLPLTAVMLDLNNLKETNDIHGHRAGDEIIKGAARCIKNAFLPSGNAYRIGGDEFVVLFSKPDLDIDSHLRLLDQEIEQFNRQSPYPMAIARGYASNLGNHSYETIDSLLSAADKNMYQDKESSKGTCR